MPIDYFEIFYIGSYPDNIILCCVNWTAPFYISYDNVSQTAFWTCVTDAVFLLFGFAFSEMTERPACFSNYLVVGVIGRDRGLFLFAFPRDAMYLKSREGITYANDL